MNYQVGQNAVPFTQHDAQSAIENQPPISAVSHSSLFFYDLWREIVAVGIQSNLIDQDLLSTFVRISWIGVDNGCGKLLLHGDELPTNEIRQSVCAITLSVADQTGQPIPCDHFELVHRFDLLTVPSCLDENIPIPSIGALDVIDAAFNSKFTATYVKVDNECFYYELVYASRLWNVQFMPDSTSTYSGSSITTTPEFGNSAFDHSSNWNDQLAHPNLVVLTHADQFIASEELACQKLAEQIGCLVNVGKVVIIAGSVSSDELTKNNQLWNIVFASTEHSDWSLLVGTPNVPFRNDVASYTSHSNVKIKEQSSGNRNPNPRRGKEMQVSDKECSLVSLELNPNENSGNEDYLYQPADIVEIASVALNVKESSLLGINRNCEPEHHSRQLLSFCFFRLRLGNAVEFASHLGYRNVSAFKNDAKLGEELLQSDPKVVATCQLLLESLTTLHLRELDCDFVVDDDEEELVLEDYENVVIFPADKAKTRSVFHRQGLFNQF